jgi:nucleoid-associated protein YgaU
MPGQWPTNPTGEGAATAPAAGSPGGAPLTYVVKPGDNLSDIAAWFKLNGYQSLYEANAAVIGGDPDLIHPGQVITVSDGQMSVG